MGKVTRKRYGAEFKAKVALEAIKGELTLAELSAKHGIHQTMIAAWKRQAIEGLASTFSGKAEAVQATGEAELTRLARQDWPVGGGAGFFGEGLRSMSVERRREMVEASHPHLSIVRQCALLQISRSGRYYQPVGESEPTLALMRLIDEAFLECPYYGSRQMMRHLHRLGHRVGRNRVARLMRKMGLRAIYQKPNTSAPHPEHRVYPYLLRDSGDRAPQPGLVLRHHLHPDAAGLPVSGGDHGLAQPPGAVVAAVQHHGCDVLHGGTGGGVGPAWQARDLQHRPGKPIHQPVVHPEC